MIDKSFGFFMSYSNVFCCFYLPFQVVPKFITIFTRTTKYTKRGIMAFIVVRLLIYTFNNMCMNFFFTEVKMDNCCSVFSNYSSSPNSL